MNIDKQTGFHISKESVDKLFPKKNMDILGYESPINVVMGQMRMEQENNIYKAIQEYGVNVDKEELVKALQYDRGQYDKGYVNGYNAGASEVALEVIEEVSEVARCSADEAKLQADTEKDVLQKSVLRGMQIGALLILSTLVKLKKKYVEVKNDV